MGDKIIQVEYYPIGARVEFTDNSDFRSIPFGAKGTVIELDMSGHRLSHKIKWDELKKGAYVSETWETYGCIKRLDTFYKQGDRVIITRTIGIFPAGTCAIIKYVDQSSSTSLQYYIEFSEGSAIWAGNEDIELNTSWKPPAYNPHTFEAMNEESIISAEEELNLFTEKSRSTIKESEIDKLSRVEKFIF